MLYKIIAKDITIVLKKLERLPLREYGFYSRIPDENAICPISCGVTHLGTQDEYYHDNRKRDHMCLFQYTISGTGYFEDFTTGNITELTPGCGFLINIPGAHRYWHQGLNQWKFFYVLYRGKTAIDQTQRLIETYGHIHTPEPNSAPVQTLCNIVDLGADADCYVCSAQVYTFIMQLSSFLCRQRSDALPDLIEEALGVIEKNYHQSNFGASELAERCGYSRFYFSRNFRSYLEESPQNYIIRHRLKKALEALTGSRKPVKEIAFACGFNDYSYFCKMFRRQYGVSPGSLRQRR